MNNLLSFFLGMIAMFLIVVFVIDPDKIWQEKTVKYGHGEYNRTTGEFQWLPPCRKDN